jgi:quinol monooxygenase YgiN
MAITFTTTPDTADQFAAVLEQALPLVQDEAGTTTWIAARSAEDPMSFTLVDLFSDGDALIAHMQGTAAALILGQGGPLLAGPPEITTLAIVAAKTPPAR